MDVGTISRVIIKNFARLLCSSGRAFAPRWISGAREVYLPYGVTTRPRLLSVGPGGIPRDGRTVYRAGGGGREVSAADAEGAAGAGVRGQLRRGRRRRPGAAGGAALRRGPDRPAHAEAQWGATLGVG